MTEVRIRHVNDAEGAVLAEVPFTGAAFDDVIRILNGWGVEYDDDGDGGNTDVAGSFVYRDGRAFFEVVIGE